MGSLKTWVQDNPLGIALGALSGCLLLAWLVLAIMSSLPLPAASEEELTSLPDPNLDLPTLTGNQPMDTYNVIVERPLFNESRLPILDDETQNDELSNALEEDAKRPEVELAGVVITPSLRMVTLKRKDNEKSLVAFEGQPVEADFGGWQVSRIEPRMATLRSAGGQELLLEMKVHDAAIEPPPPVVKKEQAAPASADNGEAEEGASQPLSRAEEIRQRIAERREELRREAEEADLQEEPAAKPPPSYQQAIQSMIAGKRKDKQ